MKKILISILSTLLIFSFVPAAMAIDLSYDGRVRFNYLRDQTIDTYEDKLDILAYVHAKIDDDTTFTVGIRDYTKSASIVDSVNDSNKLYIYEGYATFKKPFGTITVGSYDFWTSGDLTVLDYIVNDIQSDGAVIYEAPFKNGFIAKAFYGRGTSDNQKIYSTKGVWDFTLGYASDVWGLDINAVDSRLKDTSDTDNDGTNDTASGDYYGVATVVNAFYVPVKPLRLYYNYETRDENGYDNRQSIVGFNFSPTEKLAFIGEYDTEKTDTDLNNWGFRINYKITKNTLLAFIRLQEKFHGCLGNSLDADFSMVRLQISF